MPKADPQAIQQVIEKAYIEGIHTTQDEDTVRSGFHQDFAMLIRKDDGLEKVNLAGWLVRVEGLKKENPDLWAEDTHHTFEIVDVAGYAAVAKLEVYKGDTHFATDYMLLYKFETGWRIVSKIFSIPG